jgi:hypothetical protein
MPEFSVPRGCAEELNAGTPLQEVVIPGHE